MKKSVFILIVIMVSCMLNLTACGKEIVAEQPAPTTEPAITTELPEEGEATPAVGPTTETKPTKEVAKPEPTVEPEPTEEAKPTEEPVATTDPEPTEEPATAAKYNPALAPYIGANEELPTPKVDVNDYISNGYFDFIKFQEDMGCEHWFYDEDSLSFVGVEINGWNVVITSDPWYDDFRWIEAGMEKNITDNYGILIVNTKSTALKVDIEESPGVKEERFGYVAIQMLPYVIEWCGTHDYTPSCPPGVFEGQWSK